MSELPVDVDQLPVTLLYSNLGDVQLKSLPGTRDILNFLTVFLSPSRKILLQYFK
jgi:hypothetical protein